MEDAAGRPVRTSTGGADPAAPRPGREGLADGHPARPVAGAVPELQRAYPAIDVLIATVDAFIDERADHLAGADLRQGDRSSSVRPVRAESWREALALGKRLVHERFEAGAPAAELLAARTAVVDRVLMRLWIGEGQAFDGLTLLAVGGYGRGELHPCSDVDIAILVPERDGGTHEERLSGWITALWDLGLDLGHSVRTVAECEREAAADITVVTNLMEARLLCGEPALLERMRHAISPDRIWPPAEFFRAKLAERKAREARFHTNAYRLEPNVKESRGGLRDFQTLAWVCQRQFGRPGIEPLVDSGLLEPDELATLREGLALLWRVRYLLHHLAGRREDRLLFDYQRDIAHAFGHLDDTDNRAIEALMQRYYRTVMALQRLAEIVLQGLGGILSGVTAAAPVTPIGRRYQLRNGFLEVRDENTFLHYPPALLEIFLVFGDTPGAERLRSHTVRLIRKHLPLINDRFRSDPQTRWLFLAIFRNPNKLTRKIRMMNGYGVLAAYLPAFDAIVGRMQYDLFHIYTVDEHTINVIRNLRRFTVPEHADEFPQCSAIAGRLVPPLSTLYLAGLFHDIAKGRGGDHSELGARDAAAFAVQHGLGRDDADLLVWIVRHHLLMSMTAQSKDIDDPSVQLEFARTVGTLERLDHLYLLTVADIRATNPTLWNSFRQSLLQSLYRHARLILERGLDKPLGEETVIARRQANTVSLLDAPLIDDPRRTVLWESLGEPYFRQYQAAEIARHTEILLAARDTTGPLVSLRHSPSRGSMEILIYTPDDEALFALITTVLERLTLDVLSATINTSATGHALDTFHVLEADGSLIETPERSDEIRLTLIDALSAPKDIPALTTRRPSRRLRHFNVSTDVVFRDDEAGLTALRITASDRPGILSSIARILLCAGISVHAARIATLGERIDDVFFIGMPDGRPVADPALRERLAAALRERL